MIAAQRVPLEGPTYAQEVESASVQLVSQETSAAMVGPAEPVLWSQYPPSAPKCMALPPLVNGEVSWNALTVGSVASYVCDEGYVLDGTPQRDCVQDTVDTSRADWNLQAPTCQRKPVTSTLYASVHVNCTAVECDPLEVIENGEVEVSGLVPNSVADYMCTEGFVLIGQERRVCEHVDKTSTRGEWSGVEPSCQRKTTDITVWPN